MATRVIKRNGKFEQFNPAKIERAMLMAFNAVQPDKIPDTTPLRDQVLARLNGKDEIHIETIQDEVEKVLMHAYEDVAKAYILYRNDRARARAAMSLHRPDPRALGDYIHPAKYARYLPEQKRRETYLETSHRSRDMHVRRWPHMKNLIHDYWRFVDQQRVLPSMRSMQFAGFAIEYHNARMYNCSFSYADRIRFFQEAFYLLLCGCGVGFSVQFHHVDQMPAMADKIDYRYVFHYQVPDNIEGWADAVGELFKSFVKGYYVEFDYSRIRPEGSQLHISGGKAPGHLPLKRCIENLRSLLLRAVGRRLRPIEVNDCVCYIAEAVLSGGIRRSSLITLFSHDDGEMIYAKAPENFQYGGLNAQRQMANISAVLLREKTDEFLFRRILAVNQRTHGEPGFYFTDNLDYGCNPCGEIGMHPRIVSGVSDGGEWAMAMGRWNLDEQTTIRKWGLTGWSFCNLCEVNCQKAQDAGQFYGACEAAAFIGTLQAAYANFPYLGPVTEAIVRRDALIGVGLMGIHDNPDIALNPSILRYGSSLVSKANQLFSQMINIRSAARTTTVKPGSTAPKEVIPMVASGISYHHAKRYFMRVTANPLEPVANYFRKFNPHMVEEKPNGDWSIIFCIEAPENAITTKEATAVSLVDDVFLVYENWIRPGTQRPELAPGLTHNVSCTITFRPDEYNALVDRIWQNRERITAMAFFPIMSDKGIPFVPREEVSTPQDELKWQYLIENYKPIDYSKMVELEDGTTLTMEQACAGGKCEV